MRQAMGEPMRFLKSREKLAFESASSPEQLDCLRKLVRRSSGRLTGEIGFNAGFSSFAFLSAGPEVLAVSSILTATRPRVMPRNSLANNNQAGMSVSSAIRRCRFPGMEHGPSEERS